MFYVLEHILGDRLFEETSEEVLPGSLKSSESAIDRGTLILSWAQSARIVIFPNHVSNSGPL